MNFCEECEATKDHGHSFLKIMDPKKAPNFITTAINCKSAKEIKDQIKENYVSFS